MSDGEPPSINRQDNSGYLIAKPDGTFFDLFAQLDKEHATGNSQVNISLLQPGDIVGMQFQNEDGNGQLMFVVEHSEINHAGINVGSAQNIVYGKLRGFVPMSANNELFILLGSGFGHTTQFGVVAEKRALLFASKKGRYQTPIINSLGVYRADESGNIQKVQLGEQQTDSLEYSEIHKLRIQKIQNLLIKFGFHKNLIDCSQSTSSRQARFEDSRYVANYEQGMALGNRIAIYDKHTGLWMMFGYYNFKGEDALKIAFAKIPNQIYKKMIDFGSTVYESAIRATDLPIITFNTSPQQGIKVINYLPGDETLGEIGIADYDQTKYRHRGKPPIAINLFPDGTYSFDVQGFFTPIEESHPDALNKLRAAITAKTLPSGTVEFKLNGKDMVIYDPDEEIDKLLKYFDA